MNFITDKQILNELELENRNVLSFLCDQQWCEVEI